MEQDRIRLVPMTPAMYYAYFKEYENDPDLYLDKEKYVPYEYSEEKVTRYIRRLEDLKRIPLAILCDEEVVGEIVIKNIEERTCATMGLTLKNARYKDQGIGTQAEKLAVQYVFQELDIPVQRYVTKRGGTDGSMILDSRGGVPTGTLSVPIRYTHTANEVASLEMAEQCAKLLAAAIAK